MGPTHNLGDFSPTLFRPDRCFSVLACKALTSAHRAVGYGAVGCGLANSLDAYAQTWEKQ